MSADTAIPLPEDASWPGTVGADVDRFVGALRQLGQAIVQAVTEVAVPMVRALSTFYARYLANPTPEQRAQRELDSALDYVEQVMDESVAEFRHWARRLGQKSMEARVWAQLTPGLTWEDVSGRCTFVLAHRWELDWSEAEARELVMAYLEGWSRR